MWMGWHRALCKAAQPCVTLTRPSLRSCLREGAAKTHWPAGSLVAIAGQVTPSPGAILGFKQ